MRATVNNLQHDLFAKFRIAKTRVEWKKELEKCKYIPSTSTLPMINKLISTLFCTDRNVCTNLTYATMPMCCP